MKARYHSTFTPSESDRETLERLLVAREELVRGIMDGIRESARSGNKHQRLLIGPRGMGKTHLVALVYHRVREDAELSERLRIAWLQEDPYIAGYPDLLLEILRTLAREHAMAGLQQQLDEVLDLNKSREAALERLLLETLGERILLLITENLDDLLRALKEVGQHKLRAFLQNHPKVTILATATSLVDAVAERKKTFYGFFRISLLEPFSVEQAVQLLARLADRAEDADLAAAIRSAMGLARIRAVHYLAGGNPRIYVLLYDFLNRESLDDLARPFLKLVDELTPYYQARMSQLAPLQRRIINVLRRLRGASTVTEIARQAMSSPQSISSQLGKLKDLGYVIQVDSLGRSNYYELREPLMRLVLEVKDQQGRTVELFVQFLRVWYSETELDRLTNVGATDLETAHLYEAARRARSERDPLLISLRTEFFKLQSTGRHEEALAEAEIAIQRAPQLKESWARKAECLAALDRDLEEQLACWRRVTEIDPEDWRAWNWQAELLYVLAKHEEALDASRRAVELAPENWRLNRYYSVHLLQVGRANESKTYLEKALRLSGEAMTASQWDQRGNDLWDLNRRSDALKAYCKALELDPYRIEAWGHLAGWLREQGKIRLCRTMLSRMLALMPEEASLHVFLGIIDVGLGRDGEALAAYENALRLDPELDQKGIFVSLYRASVLTYLNRDREALDLIEKFRLRKSGLLRFRLDLVHARALMWMGRWEEGQSELDYLLRHHQPPLWTGRELRGLVGHPLLRSSNPEIWRRFLTIYLASFGRCQRLAELGQGLVHTLPALIEPRISDQTAQAWYQTWQELAGDTDEMALPLRLLGAVVEYRVNRDPRVLLRLPREERGLLEPWLVNLFEDEPSEIDHEIEALLHTAEQRLSAEAEARAFWKAPAPDLVALDFSRLLRGYGERAPFNLGRLLPGPWQSLSRSEAERLLRHVATHDENGARTWSRSDLKILTIDRLLLSFSSDWFLYQIHLCERDLVGALDLLASESQAVVLDGLNQTLRAPVQKETIRLETDEAWSDYTRFVCSVLRYEKGRFQIVDRPADFQLATGIELPAGIRIQPWEPADQPSDDGSLIFAGTVRYFDELAQVELRSSSPERGFIEILKAKPLAWDLPSRTERFDGPIRFFVAPLEGTDEPEE